MNSHTPWLLGFLAVGSCMALSAAVPVYDRFAGSEAQGSQFEQVLPAVEAPLVFRNVAPAEAAEINAAIPVAGLPIVPARRFEIADKEFETPSSMSALSCLTAAIYYEGGYEPEKGQRAIAQVVLNRVRHPAYPNSVCGVVFQGHERTTGCQFSFTCDGSRNRVPNVRAWNRAAKVARDALSGRIEPSVGTATHYHTIWVTPYWQSSLAKIGTIGAHIFYRWSGSTGGRQAFVQAYSGREAFPAAPGMDGNVAVSQSDEVANIASVEFAPAKGVVAAVVAPAMAADRQGSSLVADMERGELLAGTNSGTLVAR